MTLVTGTPTNHDEGADALALLIDRVGDGASCDWNEAQTRLGVIDELLRCLGWDKHTDIQVENHTDGLRTDYELGEPCLSIWEAKKPDCDFTISPSRSPKAIMPLPAVLGSNADLRAAVEQVQMYCVTRGAALAVATNGNQLVAFLPVRSDGTAPLKGKCLIAGSLDDIQKQFEIFWNILSAPAVRKKLFFSRLRGESSLRLPEKLSTYLQLYPKFRYPSDTQTTLRTVADLLIQDIPDAREAEFIRECYCNSGALDQDALISKQILRARYSALFHSSESEPSQTSISDLPRDDSTKQQILAEAFHNRPIILLGDVGVGKSSFLKHLIHVDAAEIFSDALYLVIDLGEQAALAANLREFVLDELGEQLFSRYNVDIEEEKFVKGAYASEISKFKNSIFSEWAANAEESKTRLLKELGRRIDNKTEHLRRSIEHLSAGRHKQVVILIDNADQRDDKIQHAAFIIA